MLIKFYALKFSFIKPWLLANGADDDDDDVAKCWLLDCGVQVHAGDCDRANYKVIK